MASPLPTPKNVRATFAHFLAEDPERATNYLYTLGTTSGYIKTEAIARNICWISESPFGVLECTINLSKPEKDPRIIAAAASELHPSSADTARSPQCDLCWENEGFPGSPKHPAKPGLRIAALELGGERWGLQYSPYAYFTEHCIVLSEQHRPMKINEACFDRLLDFVDAFSFYFVGSNADLPIVGGSILTHDHFQGGRHTFPLMRASLEREITFAGLPQVRGGIVKWPASVFRLVSDDRGALKEAATHILDVWQSFSYEPCGITAFSEGVPHNTLNPIVRKSGTTYTLDLVLRNNRTDSQHPWGIFHPGVELHHIKKENIGLIEIMGLAILPPRLARELPLVQSQLIEAAHQGLPAQEVEQRLQFTLATEPHAAWATHVYTRRATELANEPTTEQLNLVIQEEVAHVFATILETTGVFKRDEVGAAGWNTFLKELNH